MFTELKKWSEKVEENELDEILSVVGSLLKNIESFRARVQSNIETNQLSIKALEAHNESLAEKHGRALRFFLRLNEFVD